jgi:hypothetical protein
MIKPLDATRTTTGLWVTQPTIWTAGWHNDLLTDLVHGALLGDSKNK